ncbi:MAG: hypothetical protein IKR04_04080 [Clostridia bacterium]|nr:hypothetical protein [Clostridia bacterium]
MEKRDIQRIYSLLKGTFKAAKEQDNKYIYSNDVEMYNGLIDKLDEITHDDYFSMYRIEHDDYTDNNYCSKYTFLIKIMPIMEYLNDTYIDDTEEKIQKIGALYNAIEDTELQKRCGDILLEASGAFDRVFNQATQVLEDRIKKKANLADTTIFGLPLISKAIHSKIENTILKFSDIPDIQEHYSSLFKGIIGVYRNTTHHGLDYKCSREDALKFCAYIDLLLKDVESAVVVA